MKSSNIGHGVRGWMALAVCAIGFVAPAGAQRPGGPGGGDRPPFQPGDIQRPPPDQLLRQFDANGDGKIGRDEAPDRMRQRWDQLDTDRDGFVTLDELKARDARVSGTGTPREGGAAVAAPAQTSADFSVVTIGTGSPQYDPERSGPSALVRHKGRLLLVDAGNGTQAKLSEAGIAVRDLAAILVTHHHLDHNEEFMPVLVQTLLRGGDVEVAGPPGTAKLAAFAREFYAEDMAYRMGRRGRTIDDLGRAAVREVKGGESFELAGLKVTTAKVNHSIHTLAYRFDADGQSIVISGDLSYSDSLAELARNADVLVIDAGGAPVRPGQSERVGGGAGRPSGGAGGAGDPSRAHGSREDVCKMAQQAGVKKLVLTHIAPGEVDEDATRKALGDIFKGEVIVGRDLLEIAPRAAMAASSSQSPAAPNAADTPAGRAYVNAAIASGKHDGRSWATAFASVQDALASSVAEIWVARGTYKPTTGADRNATFQLKPGVRLYGGFAGAETKLEQRDWERNRTILSGDIGRDDEVEDNVFHVVTGADNAVLDGFTVTGGYSLNARPAGGGAGGPGGPQPPGMLGGPGGGPRGGAAGGGPGQGPIHTTPDAILRGAPPIAGAGLLNYQCAPTVRNCVFAGNRAGKGGGAYNMTSTVFPPRPDANSKTPVFVRCVFRGNYAEARGGGVCNDLGTSPAFVDCVFEDNRTAQKGGGMYNDFGCSPVLANCLFTGNEAESAAAMGNDGASSPVLEFCTFTKNHASDTGPSLYQGTGPANNPTIIRCLIAGNTCDWGGTGLYNWHDNSPVIRDCAIDAPATGDIGYKPGRIGEAQVPVKIAELAKLRAMPVREADGAAPDRIPSSERIVFANAAAGGAGARDGQSWATAHVSLQAAIDDAAKDGAEVWVAAGTYKPGGDRSVSFVLKPGVRLLGGFAGRETTRGARDPAKNATVLDGGGAYHVLVGANGASLDGFTITGGRADGEGYDAKGGGLIAYRRGPQGRPNSANPAGFSMEISRCVFKDNRARDGGAVYSYDRAEIRYRDCVFERNEADYGGAVLDRVGVASTFENCVFRGNAAAWRGGAVCLDYGARATFNGGSFEGNTSGGHGGALFTLSRASQLENTTAALTGCAFTANRAKGRGGAIANTDSTILEASNCTFAKNEAGQSGGAVSNFQRGRATLTGCRHESNKAGRGPADVDLETTAAREGPSR